MPPCRVPEDRRSKEASKSSAALIGEAVKGEPWFVFKRPSAPWFGKRPILLARAPASMPCCRATEITTAASASMALSMEPSLPAVRNNSRGVPSAGSRTAGVLAHNRKIRFHQATTNPHAREFPPKSYPGGGAPFRPIARRSIFRLRGPIRASQAIVRVARSLFFGREGAVRSSGRSRILADPGAFVPPASRDPVPVVAVDWPHSWPSRSRPRESTDLPVSAGHNDALGFEPL